MVYSRLGCINEGQVLHIPAENSVQLGQWQPWYTNVYGERGRVEETTEMRKMPKATMRTYSCINTYHAAISVNVYFVLEVG